MYICEICFLKLPFLVHYEICSPQKRALHAVQYHVNCLDIYVNIAQILGTVVV